MVDGSHVHSVAPSVLIEFLRKTLPFSELPQTDLEKLALGCVVDFFPKGTLILQQDVSSVVHLYLIQKGAVRVHRVNDDKSSTLLDYRGEGDNFGALAIMSDRKVGLTVEAAEDTFCFLIRKEAFLELVRNNPVFAQNFFRGLSEGLVGKAYSELRRTKVGMRTDDAFYLFSSRVRQAVKRPVETIGASESIQRAAEKMAQLEIG